MSLVHTLTLCIALAFAFMLFFIIGVFAESTKSLNMAKARIKIIIDTDSYVIVAAIDFGTTHSGFAFSTKSKPNDIIMNKNWGSEYSHESYKCPTSVLTDPQGKFVSFGYMAENDYSVKLEEGRENYQLYRHFKMSLDQKNVRFTFLSKMLISRVLAIAIVFSYSSNIRCCPCC